MLQNFRFIIILYTCLIPLTVFAVNEKKLTVVNLIESSENTLKILDEILAGRKPIPGSYKGRKNSEPENNRKTLMATKNA